LAAICGYTGTTSLGGEVTEWKYTIHQDISDITNMATSDGSHQVMGCLKHASGDFTTNIPCGSVGTQTGVSFTSPKTTYSSNIIITNVGANGDVNGVPSYSYSFVSTGKVTIT